MVRVSGYGQTGPYRDLPGFGVIGEAMGGLRYLNGEPGTSSGALRHQHRRLDFGPVRGYRRFVGAATIATSTAARDSASTSPCTSRSSG